MNHDDIIRMAEQAGFGAGAGQVWTEHREGICTPELERFAKLAYEAGAAAEREACAKVCDDISEEYCQREGKRLPSLRTDAESGAGDCAEAIRARSKE